MISNSTSHKLKASKSSRNNHDYQDPEDSESLDGDATGDSNHRYHIYSSRDGKFRGNRTRGSDFFSKPRGSERRGGFRGRGGAPRRDYLEGSTYDRYDSSSYSYPREKKDDIKYIKFNLPEDTRISKLLRRLSIEDDQDNSLQVSKKLLEVLMLPDNAPYIRKSFNILRDSMLNILQVAPGPVAKKQCAKAFGRMGYILAQDSFDFNKYLKVILEYNNCNDEMQCLFMDALKETLDLEKEEPILGKNQVCRIMQDLISILEGTDNVEVFKLTLENLMTCVEFCPNNFCDYFKDTTDLLFGWHVDSTQPLSNIQFISNNLLRVATHFQMELRFSVTLIENFVEDIATYTSQISKDNDINSGIEHVTVFIMAVNTVFKCLKGNPNVIANELFHNKLTDVLNQVIQAVNASLETELSDNLVIAGNECVGMLIGLLAVKTSLLCKTVLSLVHLEISNIPMLSEAALISLLLMISKVIKELSANLPIELIGNLIGPESPVNKLRHSPYKDIQEATICVYQALLNLKNIPLLQEAYKYVLTDLEVAYKLIVADVNIVKSSFTCYLYSANNAELICLFILRSLSPLANASSSIIGMWALNPSILELLAIYLKPYHEDLIAKAPTLQYSILYLLYSHCKCYSHFISSSVIINNKLKIVNSLGLPESVEDVSKSPNSNSFTVILDVIHKVLMTRASYEVILLCLQWFNEILTLAEIYLQMLYVKNEFIMVTNAIVQTGYNKNSVVALSVCKNLEKLLGNKQLSWKNNFLIEIYKLCILHMTTADCNVRENYTKLSTYIPWDVVTVEVGKINLMENNKEKECNLEIYNNSSIIQAQHLHMNGSLSGDMMSSHNFKTLMNYLLKNESNDTNLFKNLFSNSWPLEMSNQELNNQFRNLTVVSKILLNNWMTWESAQVCVNNKLRTSLGKPNETFTSFENSLKQLARDVMKVKQDEKSQMNKDDLDRVRLLLQFIEHLEMCIYNASEGSAVGIPQAAKPVRVFFNTNASTCREWLLRIRIILVQIALHAGQSVIALRHGQELILDIVNNNRAETVEFERAVMYVTLSLLNLQESDAIMGLYVWCKGVKRKFPWIKIAAEQANKKYEEAILGYQTIVKEYEKNEIDLDIYVKHFISDQIIYCNKELNNWIDIVGYKNNLLSTLLSDCENGMRYSFNTVNFECAQSLFTIETSTHTFNDLTVWSEVDNGESWSVYDTLKKVESDLYNIALNIAAPDNESVINSIDDKILEIHKIIQENLLHLPSEFLKDYCLLNYIAMGLRNVINDTSASTVFLVSEEFEEKISQIDSPTLSKILWWSEYFAKIQNQGFSTFSSNLRLNIIKKARKESNHKLATSQLYRFLNNKNLLSPTEIQKKSSLLTSIAESFKTKIPEITMWNVDMAKGVQEIIKLLYDENTDRKVAFDMCAIASTSISKCADMFGGIELKQISSKILLKLSIWLQNNEHVSFTEITSPLGKLLMVLPEIGLENMSSNIIPINEMVIGKLLQFSVNQCQTLAKSWNAFGTWCYRWGRKIVDSSYNINKTLTPEDHQAIEALLPLNCKEEDLNRIFLILSQSRAYVDEEDISANEVNTSEMIRNQLKNVPALFDAENQVLEALVQIWRNLQKRVYAYYGQSVDAYFKYLHLVMNSENMSKSNESTTITVTLRLLRLIVKHALELQNVLEAGLASTPTDPWKVIIPQLFSRLNHPESYVRERVSELLCRVAEDAPHLITFPAVVGALEGGVKFDFSEISLPKDCLSQNNDCNDDSELNDIEETYESDNDESKNVLQACFKSMVETLSKQAHEAVSQVELLVKELRRIILLWDELWLGTLAQHQTEINKRQVQLEMEIEKVNSNNNLTGEEKISLISEKHRIIIKPIIFILEQLHDITSQPPETPHEKQFKEKYSEIIEDVLMKLKNPENPDKPQESWKLLKELQNQFQQKAHKRSWLKMYDISPTLASITDTLISMPGQALKTKVHISHISNQVSILPTKTKPKKLIFYGSDGHTYTYLFKGLEDLHLDERIMQFLSIANTMMAQNMDETNNNLYRARHYSVIPLGPRSGLISWVGGTTPVFALYKRWQQREATKLVKTSTNTPILRPSELFYNKLNPLLQEHGVKNIDNRKEWPLVVLKQVLTELMAETPSDLLAKELWCHSINPGAWWQMVRKYSYSVAVMSIIGYIIGLGDRHLDNVLVDLSTGEVVHIDYNVCFEKGKTLRVPEKVPFRLTPNLRDALGVTGVEGIFRLACENILKIMKKGRETLLTLLEAFVYDPLVDWTVGNDGLVGTTFGGITSNSTHKQTRKDLEKEVTLSMYRVRCTEMKISWSDNREDILKFIPSIDDLLDSWKDNHEKLVKSEDTLQDLHQQMALVKEAEANGICKHSLLTLPSRFESFRKSQEAIKTAKRDLEKLMQDCKSHLERFNDALKNLQSQQLQQWYNDNNKLYEKDEVFCLVKEFLQNAGQANMITQCEQSENDVLQMSEKQTMLTLKCLDLLQEYWIIYSQCPVSFHEDHRISRYIKWSETLLNTFDLNTCENIYQEFFNMNNITTKPVNAVIKFAYHLNVLHNNTAAQASKAFAELNKLRSEDVQLGLEKLYKDAKVCLTSFLKHEKSAPKALEFVVISELLLLNRTFLTLEKAASKSGDWLIKLTSRDGDWFLDELTLNCSKAIEFINYLKIQNNIEEDPKLMQVFEGLQASNNMYKSLHELNFNFHTIILPESIKKIQSEEPSVLQMIHDLNGIIANVGYTLPELISQLENQLQGIVMEMDHNPSYDIFQAKLSNLKLQYQALLHSSTGILTPGKMLLMGFNGLFDKLNLESANIINTLGNLEIPSCWRKLDQVKEAKSLAAPIFNLQVRAILDDIFLLKRLQTMYEFFMLCTEMYQPFQTQESVVVLNDEQLIKPIRKFIADFISRQFLGITTEAIAYIICFLLQRLGLDVTNEIEQKDIGAENKVPLDELYHIGWTLFLKTGAFTQNVLGQASSVESNLKNAWEKIQEPKKLEKSVALFQSSVARIQNQITMHNWLYEDILIQQPMVEKNNLVHNKFVVDLQNKTNNLNMILCYSMEMREKQKALIASISQRLKWGAGANPDLNEVLAAFENALIARDKRLDVENQISNLVLATCNDILHYEILRTNTNESKTYDNLFLSSQQKWMTACQYKTMKTESVSFVEENIMKFFTPDMITNINWINVVSEKISDTIKLTQKLNLEYKASLKTTTVLITNIIEEFKIYYGKHCEIMNEFKNLIKSMTKIESCDVQAQQFITYYRSYIEHFSTILHKFKKGNFTIQDLKAAKEHLQHLKEETANLYASLMELEEGNVHSQPLKQEGMSSSPMKMPPFKQESLTKGQQRNSYAVGVWRRVRMKLEGRDPDPGRKCTTQEQVDYVIREATNLDNLALLYEGWTPWV